MIRYKIKYTDALCKQTWQNIIHPTHLIQQTAWYLRHRDTFGNVKWMFIHCVLPVILIMVVETTAIAVIEIYGHVSEYIEWGTTLFTAIVLLIFASFYCTLPKFQDSFYISGELRRIIIFGIFVLLKYLLWAFGKIMEIRNRYLIDIADAGSFLMSIATFFLDLQIGWLYKRL